MNNSMVAQAITGLIFVIIGVVLITALAVTVTDNTNTDSGSGLALNATLENVSGDAKSLYGLYDLVWAAGGLILVVAGLFTIAKSFGKGKM